MHKQKQHSVDSRTTDISERNGFPDITLDQSADTISCTLELTRNLRAKNDLYDLIHTYSNTIQRLAPHDHLRFEHKTIDIDIEIGHCGIHKCTYNLFFSHYSLGRVTLSRNEKFNDEELSSLENTLCVLFNPLEEMIHKGANST